MSIFMIYFAFLFTSDCLLSMHAIIPMYRRQIGQMDTCAEQWPKGDNSGYLIINFIIDIASHLIILTIAQQVRLDHCSLNKDDEALLDDWKFVKCGCTRAFPFSFIVHAWSGVQLYCMPALRCRLLLECCILTDFLFTSQGQLLTLVGEVVKAEIVLLRILNVAPSSIDALRQLSAMYGKRERHEEVCCKYVSLKD